MKLNINKIKIAMARKKLTVKELAEAYGVSRARMNAILGQRTVTPAVAGRLADALSADVTEILKDE